MTTEKAEANALDPTKTTGEDIFAKKLDVFTCNPVILHHTVLLPIPINKYHKYRQRKLTITRKVSVHFISYKNTGKNS